MNNRILTTSAATGALLAMALSAMAIDVPVDDIDAWTSLSYRKIPANEISVANGGLRIAVDKSSSPLVYRLAKPALVRTIRVRARWTGALVIPDGLVQGEKNADDFVLKVGLVESGEQTLNWFQRKVAADWILQLHKLAPEGSGVKRINFVSTTQQAQLLGSSRTHPLSDLLYETRVLLLEKPGEFTLTQTFDQPVETLGLWISADGDDSGSVFDVQIESIELIEP